MKKSFCFTLMILSLTACGKGIDYLLKPIDETNLRTSTWFQGKLRIHLKGYPDDEITVSKEKVSAVKRWLDS